MNILIGSMAIDMSIITCVSVICGIVASGLIIGFGLDFFMSSRKERKIKRMKAKRQSCSSCVHRIVSDEIDRCRLAETEYWNVITGELDNYCQGCHNIVGEKQCKWKQA